MTERVQIIVPTSGVRKDVADLIQTPDMMRSGVNVMVYDGTVRPRPGSNRVDIGGVVTTWAVIGSGINCFAALTDTLLKQETVDDLWLYSLDHGFEWFDITADVTGPVTVNKLVHLRTKGVLLAFDSLGDLWTADVSTFPTPTDITFTKLGSYKATFGTSAVIHFSDPVFYDSIRDTLWWQTMWYGGQGLARINSLTNASTVTAGTYAANRFCGPKAQTWQQKLIGCGIFNSEGFGWTRSTSFNDRWMYRAYAPDGDAHNRWFTCDEWFAMLHSYTQGPLQRVFALRGRALYNPPYVSNAYNDFDYWKYPVTPISEAAQLRVWQVAGGGSDGACAIGADNIRTSDNWATYEQYEDFPGNPNNIICLQAYDNGDEYYFLEATNKLGAYQAWFVNGQTGTGVQGDALIGKALSLFQGDLDTEPSGLYLGTEHRLLHFNLDTEIWDDLSPQYIESDPPDPGDDLTYKIDGDSDQNRWVFRVTEKMGDKYIIATNGQIPPVAWKETLDEFRPVGDVDEDGVIGEGETGAPLATCMAMANNRLILGRDLSIFISAPQDFDTGYGDEYKLTDTYGPIVAMRELNALTIAVLKSDAIYHGISQVEFMGVSAPMRFELIKAGIVGPCTDAGVVYLPDGRICWLGRDGGVYVYDGAVPVDIGRHIRHAISPLLDTDRLGWVHATVDTKRNLLWFFFPYKAPTGYGMNMGLVLSIDQGSSWPAWFVKWPVEWQIMSSMNVYTQTDLTYGDFPDTTYLDMQEVPYGAFEGGVWRFMFVRDNLACYTMDWDIANDNELPVSVLMETGWYDFDDVYAFDTFHEMHHLVELVPHDELTWTLISEQSDGGELSQSAVLRKDSPRLKTSYRQTGRRHRFRMEGDVTSVFRWGGAAAQFSRRGGR